MTTKKTSSASEPNKSKPTKAKKPAAKKPRAKAVKTTEKQEPTQSEFSLVLRTCNADMTSNANRLVDGHAVTAKPFVWPKSGHVECDDWTPDPVCGGGLHGLLWGRGDFSLMSSDGDAIWLVVKVRTSEIVEIDDQKCKFPRGEVVYCGNMADAITQVLCHADANRGAAASSGNSSQAASSGENTIAAVAGLHGTALAGKNGCFALAYFDGTRNRFAVGIVGENGIKPDTLYRVVDEQGALVEVDA